jgi:septal ring factor EnvC (AmiA/AmiB activator)
MIRSALRRTLLSAGLLLVPTLVPLPSTLYAQESPRIRAQRDELERIRREREALERRAADLRTSIHDLSEEVENIERRADATARIVKALDNQLATINGEVTQASTRMTNAESELTGKRSALRQRLVDIYKRGPLFTTQALLSARSFGELVARYKYLHLLALRDRALVHNVERLRDEVAVERNRLMSLQTALADNRTDKRREEEQLRALEREQSSHLAKTKGQVRAAEDRLASLKKTEVELTTALGALENERRRAESARPNAPRIASSIRTSDYGSLSWPVDGTLVYSFGKAQTASNTTIRWNGVGIEASMGTAVRVVSAGKVVMVRQFGTYGLIVVVDHGGGDYSTYGSLSHATVRENETVVKGQQIGAVGKSDPELPPHLHFEIRHDGIAVDPANWLRGR